MALATASGASAATIPVSPGGSDTCGLASPCSLLAALTTGLAGNDLVLAPGDYSLPTLPLAGIVQPRSIAGDPDEPRPRITLAPGVSLPMPTESLRHVDVVADNTTLVIGGAAVEDATVTSTALAAVSMTTGVMRNSVVRALAPNATGIDVAGSPLTVIPAKLRNVTVLASGAAATAVHVAGLGMSIPNPSDPLGPPMCLPAMPAAADLVNVIARGEGHDLASTDAPCGGIGKITAKTSNFDPAHSTLSASSVVAGLGNQADAPRFVDEAAGDLRQAAGSPTIDAGTAADDIGAFDLAGVQRILGSLPDIGAFEFVPPVAPPGGGTPAGGTPGGGTPGGGTAGGGIPGTADKAPTVRLPKAKGLRLRALLKRGWKLRVSCSEACRFAMTLTPAKRKKRVLARGAARTTKAGTTTLRLKLTKAGRRALKAQKRSIRLRVAVVARDSAGQRDTASRVLRARR